MNQSIRKKNSFTHNKRYLISRAEHNREWSAIATNARRHNENENHTADKMWGGKRFFHFHTMERLEYDLKMQNRHRSSALEFINGKRINYLILYDVINSNRAY